MLDKLKNISSGKENIFDEKLSGVHVYNSKKIFNSYRFYDGKLIDINGKVIKEFPFKYLGTIDNNGDYYAQEYYESVKWGKFNKANNAVWVLDLPIHHEILLTPQNTIITFTKEMHNYKGRKVDFCVILELNKNGEILSKWSTWEKLVYLKQFHPKLELERPRIFFLPEKAKRKDTTPWGGNYDYYRLNSIQIIPENELGKKDKRFQEGNWLISFRHGSIMLILDKDSKEVVWKCLQADVKDNIEGQHSPQMLENGNILLFDNGRYRGWSRVIEINPLNYEIIWEYKTENPKDFFSLSEGYVQLLPNKNLLITEAEKGHVFELTPEKEIVWEFYHPEKQDESNSLHPESFGKRQWIYRMIAYPLTVKI
jgi:hypothetical protein